MASPRFDQLDVYTTAIRYVGMTRGLVLRLRRDDDSMARQMHRAVLSIPLNLAEGAGEFSRGDKARLYRYSLRSTAETIAMLDAARELNLVGAEDHRRCKDTALRLIAMLTKLIASVNARDNGRERERER